LMDVLTGKTRKMLVKEAIRRSNVSVIAFASWCLAFANSDVICYAGITTSSIIRRAAISGPFMF